MVDACDSIAHICPRNFVMHIHANKVAVKYTNGESIPIHNKTCAKISQIVQCTCPISHKAPEMHTYLLRMEPWGIWDRSIAGLLYSDVHL